jgi:hypothetical protein
VTRSGGQEGHPPRGRYYLSERLYTTATSEARSPKQHDGHARTHGLWRPPAGAVRLRPNENPRGAFPAFGGHRCPRLIIQDFWKEAGRSLSVPAASLARAERPASTTSRSLSFAFGTALPAPKETLPARSENGEVGWRAAVADLPRPCCPCFDSRPSPVRGGGGSTRSSPMVWSDLRHPLFRQASKSESCQHIRDIGIVAPAVKLGSLRDRQTRIGLQQPLHRPGHHQAAPKWA